MATRNITTSSKAAREATAVLGLEKIAENINRAVDAVTGPQVQGVIRDAAQIVYDRVIANAKAAGVPRRAQADVFIFSGENRRKPGEISALVGLRKRGRSKPYAHGYVEWNPSRQVGAFNKTQRSKSRKPQLVIPGQKTATGGALKIGENLGTMWELGTTKMQAKPWFRPAVTQSTQPVLKNIADGLLKIIESAPKK